MTKYTTTSLIKELEKYPEDTVIETDLAFIYNFPEECYELESSMDSSRFLDYCKSCAYRVGIFEGDWRKGNVSDVDGVLDMFLNDVDFIEDSREFKDTIKSS